MENKEKIYYSITPAPGVSLLDWYLSTVDYLASELRKYTEVELIDNFGMLERANEMRHTIGYSVETDGLLLCKISDMAKMHYRQTHNYCPELTYGEFIHDNYEWMPEEIKRYCINNYSDEAEELHRLGILDADGNPIGVWNEILVKKEVE